MRFEDYKKLYLQALTHFEESIKDNDSLSYQHIKRILSRGFIGSDFTKKIPFLLTGINPSYNDKKPDDVWPNEMETFNFKEATKKKGSGHWTKKRRQFGFLCDEMAYLDLFPIRETQQRDGFERAFFHQNDFRASILCITQRIIEIEIKPKLIVCSNRGSVYYWGIKQRSDAGCDANDYDNPWMGYKVERVLEQELPDCMKKYDRFTRFPLYRIMGFVNSERRINNDYFKDTNLKGSYILEYVMEYRNKKDINTMYSSITDEGRNEWGEIWEWAQNH